MIGALLCLLGLHDWRDDIGQTKRFRYQTCARCPANRTIERESYGRKV